MKKGFTLVEMLVVVVVVVTLMGITFRLSSIGSVQAERNTAVSRLQKLENCLSGYYAAFGSYPPVRLHGSRNYKLNVSAYGIQSTQESDLNWNWFDSANHKIRKGCGTDERRDWKKVEAACKAQPLDCCFPWPDDADQFLDEMAKTEKFSKGNVTFGNLTPGGVDSDEAEWRKVQVFKFGVMSFLLPRYLIMMGANKNLYNDSEQWLSNNQLPCNPITGERYDGRAMDDPNPNWDKLISDSNQEDGTMERARIQNIPSQAACARWMPNLEGICEYSRDDRKIFGIEIRSQECKDNPGMNQNYRPELHVLGDSGQVGSGSVGQNSGQNTSGSYALDKVTVLDGFSHSDEDGDGMMERTEFFYYSPAPHQSYVLWSAGPNGRTFPPWVPRESLTPAAKACVGYWTEDDIMIMSH